MSNVAGKAYVMNVVTPMRPRLTWVQRLVYMASRALPSVLVPLLDLLFIHFARWVIIKRDQWPDFGQGKQKLQNDYLLFSSNFNGTWDQYLDGPIRHPASPLLSSRAFRSSSGLAAANISSCRA